MWPGLTTAQFSEEPEDSDQKVRGPWAPGKAYDPEQANYWLERTPFLECIFITDLGHGVVRQHSRICLPQSSACTAPSPLKVMHCLPALIAFRKQHTPGIRPCCSAKDPNALMPIAVSCHLGQYFEPCLHCPLEGKPSHMYMYAVRRALPLWQYHRRGLG